MFSGIDFYSDTVTRPSKGMREAMANAEVGDEQQGEDPTTLALEVKLSELLGKSCALFLPSATMANQIAIRLHCSPGDELIADGDCHLFLAEGGGPAANSGVQARPIYTKNGIFAKEDFLSRYRYSKGPHYPLSRLLSIENTTNMGGGVAWPQATLKEVVTTARELEMKTHMDGARLFNAVTRLQVRTSEITSQFDTVTVCLSKGLGCPVGAVLAYDKDLYPKVRRLKQLMGGAMRQSGILAAAGLYALENNINRLHVDHENANLLAFALGEAMPHIEVETSEPSTNMVFFRWNHPKVSDRDFLKEITKNNVRFSLVGKNRFRAVLHLDISRENVEKAVKIIREVVSKI